MATFVLVHGAWAGGWCWKLVTPLLRAQGHEVYTPTLTGLGERSHLAGPWVSFDTHVQDVVNLLEFEDLHDVLLVGHSLGGTVVGAVAHRVPERIARLIFLDALLPVDGRSVLQTFEDYGTTDFADFLRHHIEHGEPNWVFPVPAGGGSELDDAGRDIVSWVEARERPHPAGAVTTPIRLGNPDAERIPRSYIACTRRQSGGLISQLSEEVRVDPNWDYLEIDAVHDANLTAPDELSRMFLEIASRT